MLGVVGAVIFALGGAVVACRGREQHPPPSPGLEAVYSAMRELRVGMPRGQVVEALARHSRPEIQQRVLQSGDITLWVHYGNIDSCSLTIGFKEGRLLAASAHGEDGPQDKCPSAPPDLG